MDEMFGTNHKKDIQYIFNKLVCASVKSGSFEELSRVDLEVIDRLYINLFKKRNIFKK